MQESNAVIAILDDDPSEPIACICSLARGPWWVRPDLRRGEPYFGYSWIKVLAI